MLRVTLLGNMGADPEVRYSATGQALVSFNVAVNQVRKGPDGERQECDGSGARHRGGIFRDE